MRARPTRGLPVCVGRRGSLGTAVTPVAVFDGDGDVRVVRPAGLGPPELTLKVDPVVPAQPLSGTRVSFGLRFSPWKHWLPSGNWIHWER